MSFQLTKNRFVLIVAVALCFSTCLAKATTKKSSVGVRYSVIGTSVPVIAGTVVALTDNSDNESGQTGIGLSIVALGAIVGPGLGHFYADNGPKGLSGVMIRGLGVSAMVIGGTAAAENGSGIFSGEYEAGALATIMVFGGAVVVAVSAFNDIASVDDSVEEYNDRSGRKIISIAPEVDRRSGYYGLRMSCRF
jgi:hypothetical protein